MQRIEKLKISLKSLKNMNAEWGNKEKKQNQINFRSS